MKNIYDLSINELKEHLVSIGEPKFRATQVFSLLHKGYEVMDMPTIPASLKEKLSQDFYTKLPQIKTEQISKDGTRKYLLELDSIGTLVECVLMTQEYGKTVCVSTQVGCKMGCVFCASGREGFVRNLTSGEILSQVILMNKLQNDNANTMRIVLMGSGEPLDNFDNVVRFFELVNTKDGLNISTRNISLSTVGLPKQIHRFADLQTGVNLCISLHASNDMVRQKIMPTARKYPIVELIDSAKYYFQKTGRRVIFEYSLIDGVNSALEHARELGALLRGFPSHVNLINLNPTGGALKPPSREVAMKFMDTLIKSGVSCTMRKSKGQDIDGACGMLKLRKTV
ncbi:MAG: 23S rRNA (adenine(2503)-C(2))-methyltransferase RlmN [Firmicutes bacterium]|nr:23S rRNA (adenine(2503)-C(2))-methyltransferase RlmN [Bacillota bacterium]